MDRSQLELVDALDRTGSLTAAAERLHTAQPSLTRRLRALERQLGTPLFDRGRHGTQATPAGRAVVAAAREALAAIERADRTAARAAAGDAGILRIGTTPTLGADVLPEVLAELRRRRPEALLELTASGDSEWLLGEVLAGRLDVALAAAPARPVPGLATAVSSPQGFSLALPVDHPLGDGSPVARHALVGQPVVALRTGEGLRAVLDSLFAELGTEPKVVIEATEREMLLPFVAAGLGITIVPTRFARARAGAGLVVSELDPPLDRPVAIVHRDGRRDPLVAELVDCAPAALASCPDPGTDEISRG